MKCSIAFVCGVILLCLSSVGYAQTDSEKWQALNSQAASMADAGRYDDALLTAKRALAIAMKTPSPNKLLPPSYNNLARAYRDLREFDMAESLYKRSIEEGEAIFGKENPDVAISLANLAQLYLTQRKYGQAEPLYKRAVPIREKAFGENDYMLAICLEGLARVYQTQKKDAESEANFKRSLAILEKVRGVGDIELVSSLNSLGVMYYQQGLRCTVNNGHSCSKLPAIAD